MDVTQETRESAEKILSALLSNPNVVHSNNGGIIKMPPNLTSVAMELALQLESDFHCLTNRIDKRRDNLAPFIKTNTTQ